MIREGEESEEDRLKITSHEIFLEDLLCILMNLVLDSHSSCDSKLNKCLNSKS